MELQGKNSKHDALDALLRRYLAEQDKTGLLESAGESMLAGPPQITPSEAREADMIQRLKNRFPETPAPTVPPGWQLRHSFIVATAAMILISLGLLWLDPLGDARTAHSFPTHRLSGHGTASQVGDGANTGDVALDYNVHFGDVHISDPAKGSPRVAESLPIHGIGPNGEPQIRSNAPQWNNSPSTNILTPPGLSDVRANSPNIYAPTAPAPYLGATEPLDLFPLRGLYAQSSTQSRFYMLEPEKDHLIRSRKGTLLHIPKQAFVDASSGEAVTELVQVEVKEVYNRSDFLKTNLPTVSNGRQLVSGGVVLVDAVAAGRRLALAKGKDIYIELAPDANTDISSMDLNMGVLNERGEMNWVNSNASTTKMVPIDLDHLYFDEFYCDCQGEKLWNNLLWAISDKAFANSWIATREFRQRLHALAELDYYSLGLMTYRDNADKDLWRVDKMVAGLVRELVPQGLAKEEDAARFDDFARQSLTQVEAFDDYGVDLAKADARRQLLFRKVSREETERIIRLDRLRREYADEIGSRLVLGDNGAGTYVVRVKPGQRKGSPKRNIRGYTIRQIGWLNLARPLGRELAGIREKDLKVRLTGEVPYESTRTFLVYNDMLSIVPGFITTGQLFRFKDIPRGSDAKIVAIGFKDGFPYLGIEPLPREGGEQVTTIAVRRLPIDDFLNALTALD